MSNYLMNKARKLHQLESDLKKITEERDQLRHELLAVMEDQNSSVVLFPDQHGVMQEATVKFYGGLDPVIVSKVYDILDPSIADGDRKLVSTKEVVTKKTTVDGVRARQLEKLGGSVAEVIQKARNIQKRTISFKEAK
jgi:hypothetical protein